MTTGRINQGALLTREHHDTTTTQGRGHRATRRLSNFRFPPVVGRKVLIFMAPGRVFACVCVCVCAAYGGPATEGGGSRGRAERSFARSTRYSSEQRTVVAAIFFFVLISPFSSPASRGSGKHISRASLSDRATSLTHEIVPVYLPSRQVSRPARDAFSHHRTRSIAYSVSTGRSPCLFFIVFWPRSPCGFTRPSDPLFFLLPVRGRSYV
jgi:hypothetical protein